MDLLSLSQEETQVILGGLLGDSYYNKLKKTIRFYHSQKQEEYLKWKHSFFIKNPNQIEKYITGKDIQTIMYIIIVTLKFIIKIMR